MPLRLIILFLCAVQCEILFEQAYMKFARHGKRQLFSEIEHIDNETIGNDNDLVIVKTRSLPVLRREAVRNLPVLQVLVMAHCRIRSIESRAFFNLPRITSINLQENELGEVKAGVFNGLPVRILTLHKNQIKKIDSRAFDDMPNLYRIKLNSNRLKAWDSDWFKNSPKLTELYFRRNKFNYLPPFAFANIKGSHLIKGRDVLDTKIFLSKNKLGAISPESFYNLSRVSQLYLDRNNISEIPAGAFRDLEEIDVVYLARNKIYDIKENSFGKVRRIGFLDLSNNVLRCLPYKLVQVASQTNLEKNEAACDCVTEYRIRLLQDKKNSEIISGDNC